MVKGYLVQDCLIHKNILLFACLTQSLKIYSLKGQSKLVVCYIICYSNKFTKFVFGVFFRYKNSRQYTI